MRVLIADDLAIHRRLARAALEKAGYEVVEATDGAQALAVLEGPDAPEIALLDWIMPSLDGLEVCRRLRDRDVRSQPYLILVTSRDEPQDFVAGLAAGADDYVAKPFDPAELVARVGVGARIVGLQRTLVDRVSALEAALSDLARLRGGGRLLE